MAKQLTVSDVESAFRVACLAARDAGLDPTGWTLVHGSASNGVAWVLATTGMTRLRLGLTRSDVHIRLNALREAWLMVADAQRGS